MTAQRAAAAPQLRPHCARRYHAAACALAQVYCHVEDVIVAEARRKQGIGSALLRAAQAYATEKGCFKCTLVCSAETQPFYASSGFECRGVNMSFLIRRD